MCELKVLHVVDFQRFICIFIPNAQRAQQHLYMGVRVGISAKYRTRSTPSSGKKKLFSLVKGTVCARRKYTSISFYRLFISFTLTVMCNLVYMYWSSFAIRCQAQTDERDKWLDRLHPVASCKYTLLAE